MTSTFYLSLLVLYIANDEIGYSIRTLYILFVYQIIPMPNTHYMVRKHCTTNRNSDLCRLAMNKSNYGRFWKLVFCFCLKILKQKCNVIYFQDNLQSLSTELAYYWYRMLYSASQKAFLCNVKLIILVINLSCKCCHK